MKSWTNLATLIQKPEALRGIDHLIEYSRRVLDRYMRTPERKPEQKKLARVA
jgi:hypothetical protein